MENIFNIKFLTKKYLIAFGSLALLLTSFAALEFYFAADQGKMASLINISGRQRMLSQRSALLATRLLKTKNTSSLEKLKKTIHLFESSHLAILRGDTSLNLPTHHFEEANDLYKTQKLDQKVKSYIKRLKIIRDQYESNELKSKAALEYINKNFDELLFLLNKAVSIYEKEAINSNENFNLIKFFGLIILLSLFFYQFKFIFIPLATKLSLGFKELEDTSRKLEKKSIEAQKLSEAKSDFLANMSHELRTPMNGILGMSDLLNLTNLTHEQREMVNTIRTSGSSLLILLNDVLDFSKLEKGKFELDPIVFNLRRMIKDITTLTHANKGSRNIEVESQVADELPEHFKGDSHRIRQILLNFLSNSVKFTDEGFIRLVVHGKQCENPKEYELIYEVQDSGIGIKKKDLDKLFKQFSQVDESISRKYGGTGLGLSISINLAKLMNGEVKVESEYGKGTIFKFIIKLEVVTDYKNAELLEEKIESLSDKYSHNILVVEDNSVNQKLAKMIFKKLGYEVVFAENGEKALEVIKNNDFSLIFMDMQMPIMDGITCTQEIFKNKLIDENKTKIVAMTANAFPEDREKCLSVGMSDFISKPIDISKIKEVIVKYSNDSLS